MAATLGMNISAGFANDLFKAARMGTSNGDFRDIAHPGVTVGSSVDYADATLVGMTDKGIPTIFPSDGGSLIFLVGESFPSWRLGTYNVTFTPGLRWTLTANGKGSRTAYDPDAGTATLVIDAEGSAGSGFFTIEWTGFGIGGAYVARTLPAANDLYFHMFKQGDNTSKMVAQAFKDDLLPFDGWLRAMGPCGVNRQATTGVTFNTETADQLAQTDALTWALSFGNGIPPEALIEYAEDCTMLGPWFNIRDTWSDAAITAYANRIDAALGVSTPFVIEYSNEMWQTSSAAFLQASSLNTRAIAAGVDLYIQYSREFKAKLALFEAVFVDDARMRPVAAWQTGSSSAYAAIMDEGSLYQKLYGMAIAPYFGGGVGGYDIGNYSDTTGFPTADRDLILTDAAAFKTACFDALTEAGQATMTMWYAFVNQMRDYCVSKGLARTAIKPITYEYASQHIVERNTPTGSSQNTLTRQAFAEVLRDARMGALEAETLRLMTDCDVDLCFFAQATRASAAAMTIGVWGMMDAVGETADEPYASIVAYLANPPQQSKSRTIKGVLS